MFDNNYIYIMIGILIVILTLYSKIGIKILFNSIFGLLAIYILNILLKTTGLYLNLNIFTGIFTGILGIPGVICLYILKILL